MALTSTHDGQGNVILYGGTATHDDMGNVVLTVAAEGSGRVVAEAEVSLSLVDTSEYATYSEVEQTAEDVTVSVTESVNAALGEVQDAQGNFVTVTQLEEYKASLEVASGSIEASFASEIKRLEDGLAAEVKTRSGLIRAAMDGLGDEDEVGVEMGVSDSELTSLVTNKRIAFRRNKEDIIAMSAEKEMLEIKSAEFREGIKVGRFQWLGRTSGNAGIVWIEEDE